MTPSLPQIILNKRIGPEQWDIWKLAEYTKKLGTWTGHFTGTSHSYSNYFFRYNQSYFIQACVPLPFVIAIGNLQFNKTLCSVTCINCKLYTCLNSSVSLRNESLLILQSQYNLWLSVNLQRPWEEGPMARLASQLLNELLRCCKWFIGWLILGIWGLIAICTTAAVTGIALQTSIQTHNFIQNWTKDAHTMWATQARIDEDIQDEIQELKTAIRWVGDQWIDVQKQVIQKCDWNSQFCVTLVQFNHSAYNWEQIKFPLQNIHDNASLNVQLLQKEIFETFSKSLPSSPIWKFYLNN